jgi:hypothetical protein
MNLAAGIAIATSLFIVTLAVAQPMDCGKPIQILGKVEKNGDEVKGLVSARLFSDGSIAVRTRLAVNPDGAAASYIKGDHGFTYVANGVDLLTAQGAASNCSNSREASDKCREAYLKALDGDFAVGTPEFCSFAIDVVPYASGGSRTVCPNRKHAYIVGNGKGRFREGQKLPSVTGAEVQPYASLTATRVYSAGAGSGAGGVTALDSLKLPITVYPLCRKIKEFAEDAHCTPERGNLVWAQYTPKAGATRQIVAVNGDVGPSFGEGSVAMHQYLVLGGLKEQAPGPIPASERCGASEKNLPHPYVSRPDLKGDSCKATNNKPKGRTDIRARSGLPSVDFVILPTQFPMKESVFQLPPTKENLRTAFADAKHTDELMRGKIACLDKP